LVFIIRIYHDARSSEGQIPSTLSVHINGIIEKRKKICFSILLL